MFVSDCTLHTAIFKLRFTHSTLITEQCTQNIAHCILYTSYCKMHNAHCRINISHCTVQTANCTVQTASYTLNTEHCTLYTAHCTLHTTQHTAYFILDTARWMWTWYCRLNISHKRMSSLFHYSLQMVNVTAYRTLLTVTAHKRPVYIIICKESVLWADSFYKSKC